MENNNKLSIIDYYDPESPEASEFRRLLHNINDVSPSADKKAVLVTSAMISEGKSVISTFLALTAAKHKNRKTLLVDFDLRRPVLHRLFNLPREKGLSEVLSEGLEIRNAIKSTSMDKLDLMTAGKPVVNPSDLIVAAPIRKAIEEMKFYYELILIDCSPLVPVSDPLLVADEVDGILLVVKAGSTPRGVIGRARDLLLPQKAKILGVVVNNLDRSLPYYYNYNYYGYQYKPSNQ